MSEVREDTENQNRVLERQDKRKQASRLSDQSGIAKARPPCDASLGTLASGRQMVETSVEDAQRISMTSISIPRARVSRR